MRSFVFSIILVVMLMGANNCCAQNTADSLTARQIVEKAITAMGGRENLLAVRTLYSEYSSILDDRPVQYIIREKFPNKGSFEIKYKEMTVHYDWFDGEKGYKIEKGVKKKAEKDAYKNKALKQNIFDELDFLNSGIWQLELVGKEIVNGQNCYKVKTTLVNGATDIIYYSDSTFLMLRSDHISKAEPGRFESALFSDYKTFGKITYFTKWVVNPNSEKPKILNLTALYINEKVEESDFK